MSTYTIKKIINTDDYKDSIFALWNKYLPVNSERRFEWMNNNPSGSPIWHGIIDQKTAQMVGCISIMPHRMIYNGKPIRAGIIGDFMIDSMHRVSAPKLQLLKKLISDQKQLGFDLIYIIPNQKAEKAIHKSGYKKLGRFLYLVRPLNLEYYYNFRYFKFIAIILNFLIKLISLETITSNNCIIEEYDQIEESLDTFWDNMKKNHKGILGSHDATYLSWRYFHYQNSPHRILVARNRSDGEIQGYIVYLINDNKLEIYDILSFNKKVIAELIKRVILIARTSNCKAVYCTIFGKNPLVMTFRKMFFLDSKFKMFLYGNSIKSELFSNKCFLYAGDRNI